MLTLLADRVAGGECVLWEMVFASLGIPHAARKSNSDFARTHNGTARSGMRG